MTKFVSGADKGLLKIATVKHNGSEVAVYRNTEQMTYSLEVTLVKLLPVPDMTDLVTLAIKEAEKQGDYVLDAQSSFVELNGVRQEFDIRSVRW